LDQHNPTAPLEPGESAGTVISEDILAGAGGKETIAPDIPPVPDPVQALEISAGVAALQITAEADGIQINVTLADNYRNADIRHFLDELIEVADTVDYFAEDARNRINILAPTGETLYKMGAVYEDIYGNGVSGPYLEALEWAAGDYPFAFLDYDLLDSEIWDSFSEIAPGSEGVLAYGGRDIEAYRDVLGVTLGDTIGLVFERFGAPSKALLSHGEWDNLVLDYSFGRLMIAGYEGGSYWVEIIYIMNASVPGPRDTFVGESVRSVIEKYPIYEVADSYEGVGNISYRDDITVSNLMYSYEDNLVTEIQLALFNG
jgi:hypothetical protein